MSVIVPVTFGSSFNKEEAERKKREAIERRRKRLEATGSGGCSQPNSQASQPVSVGTQSNGVLAAKPPPQTLIKPAPSQFQVCSLTLIRLTQEITSYLRRTFLTYL